MIPRSPLPQLPEISMKITRVETFRVKIPLKPERRMISALGRHDESHYVIVRLSTDAGIEGAGEATCTPIWSGETPWGVEAVINHVLGPAILGRDPRDIEEIDRALDAFCTHNWFAKSALEMACWDIAGKDAAKPVYSLLGGPHRPLTFRCRFSMGAYEPDRARRRSAELVQEGFQTIKVKVGRDVEQDIERVRIVREQIGPDRELYIDANCGWDADTAIAATHRMDDLGLNVAMFEQPTPDGDYASLARVRKEIRPLVMADDICFNLIHARELIRNDCCDLISLYPGKNGGIRKAARIAAYAAEHNVPCSIGSNLEWDLATAAMAHLIVGSANMQVERFPGDVLGPEYHELSIAKNPVKIAGPLVTCPDTPGLGVEVDWRLLEKLRC